MIRLTLCRLTSVSYFVLYLMGAALAPIAGNGQSQSPLQAVAPQAIDEASLVTLHGNVHPLAQSRYDRGSAPADMPAARMMLLLKRSSQQESSLQSYLQAVQDPGSPTYRKFLTPEEFGTRFGISDADLGTVQKWLQGQGFAVNKVNKGRTAIEFSGTVGQLQHAFHTTIRRYLIGGVEHFANASDPAIPAALSPVVAGVASLHDFKPSAHVVKGPQGRWSPELQRFTPDLTIASGGSQYLFVGPGDAATIYDSPNSQNIHFGSGQAGYDGAGVAIGIIGNTLLDDPGPTFYREFFGLPITGTLTTVYDENESYFDFDADETEAILDTEVSGGLAPNANIFYYAAADTQFQPGIILAIYRTIDDNKVNILSLSYGECEASLGAAGNLQILNAWEQAAAQGIAVTVSSGDSGSAGCDDPDTETVAAQGLAVNGLASTPYNIAVGGTDFDILSKNFSTYVSSTDSSTYESALSYIPENPWNDSTAANGMLATNSIYSDSSGLTNIIAGGGGASSLGNGDEAGYPKPLWQQGFPLSNTGIVRNLPDVSLLAENGRYGAMWALCIGETSDCADGTASTIHGAGGTSASAPAFAGILAMVNQKVGASTRLGQANWVLYKLAQTNPSAFHQIVTGNNSVYCSSGSLNCGVNDFITGYNAGSGYNLATGLGSVDISNLVNDWADVSLASTSTSLSLDKTSFTHGTSVNISSGVNPSAATGNVAIVNNYASQLLATTSVSPTLLPLNSGSASGSFSQFPGGTYNVYANYGGDGNHSGSVSQPVQVNVSSEDSFLQFTVDTLNSDSQLVGVAGSTIPLGTFVKLDAQPIGDSQIGKPSPITNATGTVLFTDSAGGGFRNTVLDASGNVEANTYSLSAGTHSITASYSGDLSYSSSSAGPINFTVSKAPSTILLTSSATSVLSGTFILSAQMLTSVPVDALDAYGTVTFTDTTSGAVLGSGSANNTFTCAGATTLCIGASVQPNVTQLAAGANAIVATYSGDSNFAGSGPSPPLTVTCVSGCSNGTGETLELAFYASTPTSGILNPGETRTTPVGVTPGGGFTGAVNMTCSVTGNNSGDQYIPTCSFHPTQIMVSNTQAGQTTLTVNTTAATSSALRYPANHRWWVGGTALAAMLLFGISARRFRRSYLLFVLTLCLATGWVIGCGGGGSSGGNGGGNGGGGGGTAGTTADIYTVTFRAADAATGTVTAQDYFTFTVN